jgi:hypothetical protein
MILLMNYFFVTSYSANNYDLATKWKAQLRNRPFCDLTDVDEAGPEHNLRTRANIRPSGTTVVQPPVQPKIVGLHRVRPPVSITGVAAALGVVGKRTPERESCPSAAKKATIVVGSGTKYND